MPLYQQIVLVAPKQSLSRLQEAFKGYTNTILKNGGVVRAIENNGIRPLPERTRRYYPTDTNERHFWHAKYFTTTIDASPHCMAQATRVLEQDGGVIRVHTDKLKSLQQLVKIPTFKNPLLHIK